jgi:hypothetical protein
MPFEITARTPLAPADAWARLVDWRAHGRHVPLTRVTAGRPGPAGTAPGTGVGGTFVAFTGVGRVGFADPMEIVEWDPPHRCRVAKRGRVLRGWAELTVRSDGSGSVVTWREEARPRGLPRRAGALADAVGRRLFGRVLRGLLAP